MAIVLRKHQLSAALEIESSWRKGSKNTLSVLPTGAGKTILKAEMAKRHLAENNNHVVVILAHRDVLLEQISTALCLFNLPHSFITSVKTRKQITDTHLTEFGKSFDTPGARIIVASVDKLRQTDTSYINDIVSLWMIDEAHHVLDGSKWEDCISRFHKAKGLGVTATPMRADKRGLGRHANGVFDDMSVGATMHELIELNMLSPYKIYCPPVLVDYTGVNTTASGDLNQTKNAKATDKAEITGDVIKNYKRIANGKQTICFTCNIEHGEHVAKAFNDAGIRAVNLSSKTEPGLRNRRIKEFKAGLIQVLVNCDLFGEGFDVPSVECVIMLRRTFSYSLFKQQFGRALRILEGKEFGVLIDHVGNVEYMMYEYGLISPHDDPVWTLNDYKNFQVNDDGKKSKSRVCDGCFNKFIPVKPSDLTCPECHHVPTPAQQLSTLKALQAKEADLVEMSIDFINKLLVERNKVNVKPEVNRNKLINGMGKTKAAYGGAAQHKKRYESQQNLRELINEYCLQLWLTGKYDVDAAQRQFEVVFKVNYLKAQVLSSTDADKVSLRIRKELYEMGVLK